MDAQNTSEKIDSSLAKKVNKNLVFNVCNSDTDRLANSTVDNNNSLSKTNSVERRSENYDFLSVAAHRLQNPKSITIGHLTANSLRKKIEEKVYYEVAEELIKKILTYLCSHTLTLMKLFRTNNLMQAIIKHYVERNKNGGIFFTSMKKFHAKL